MAEAGDPTRRGDRLTARFRGLPSGGLFGILVLAWGLNYLFVREGLLYSPPLWLATARTLVGVAAVGVLIRLGGRHGKAMDPAGRRDAMLIGIPTTALFFGLWFVGEGSVPPGEAAVVVYTFPLWVALLAPWVLKRRMSVPALAAIGLGFAGIVLITQPWNTSAGGPTLGAIVALLVAALSWAVGTVLYQRRFDPVQMQEANFYQLLGGGVALVGASALLEPHLPVVTVPLLVIWAWLGVVGTAIAYAIWFWLLARIPAEQLASYVFLVPVVALGFSVALLGERVDGSQIAGITAVVMSIYATGRTSGGPRTEVV
ncbi:MAG: DMT family transporter [Thermoplasmata archaeon]|nr:DMT family transporter [Thermoplasmata archaeon]